MAHQKNIALALQLAEPWQWHQMIYAGAHKYARERRHWKCVIDEYPEAMLPRRRGEPMCYDGVIARVQPSLLRRARTLGLPLVNVWLSSPVTRQVPGVYLDFEHFGKLCARHLIDRGFRRFGCVYVRDNQGDCLKWKGFADYLQQMGLSSENLPISSVDRFSLTQWTELHRQIRGFLADLQPPIGLFVMRAFDTRQLIHLSRERGWRIPQDVALICGENEPAMCEQPPPGLTSVEANWEQVGYKAAELLDRQMTGKVLPKLPILVNTNNVVPRASTDFIAVDDGLTAAALAYISKNLHRPLSLDEVAEAIATTPRTLHRRFEKCLGRSVAEELRRLRLELVKRLLRDPNKAIKEIARSTGFSHPNRLYEVFLRVEGISPQAYRAKLLMKEHTPLS